MSSGTVHKNVYPTEEQAERWTDRADEWGMGTSEFIKAAVEAGLKSFDSTAGAPSAGERAAELQDQRDRVRDENDRLRSRLRTAEDRRARTDEGYLRHALDTAPAGLTFEQAVATIRETSTARVERILEDLTAEQVVSVKTGAQNRRVYRLANPNAVLTTEAGTEPFDAETVLLGPQGILQRVGETGEADTDTAPDDSVYDSDWLNDDGGA